MMKIQAKLIDIAQRRIYPAEIGIAQGKIVSIVENGNESELFALPGFVDAHVHIESSMLIPTEFARMAVVHGTVATVSDPHEIANVMGVEGVHYMIANADKTPFKFNFGAPSCVPATAFETAGATVGLAAIEELMAHPKIKYLAEMMNYPGVLFKDELVWGKLAIAKKHGKPIDGHAPGLRGEQARQYIAAGISTDHECFTYEEAKEKVDLGMKILIREGSAAKNFEALAPLLPEHKDMLMFCSDDKHPDDLALGHINQLAARALAKGNDLFDVLQVACVNPVLHYGLDVGLLRVGDPADFILTDDLTNFSVKATYINGVLVAQNGDSLLERNDNEKIINNFSAQAKSPEDFRMAMPKSELLAIEAIDGELVTKKRIFKIKEKSALFESDIERDILKIAVVNRYRDVPPALACITGFGLKRGAIASCVAHDSHNIIAVGTTDADICRAVNLVIQHKGGIAAVDGDQEMALPLPVAGIMTTADGHETGRRYAAIDRMAKEEMGCTLRAPFMTLSFMALLVIPSLKLSDLGLFDGDTFEFVNF
jgi:adenine deaminase